MSNKYYFYCNIHDDGLVIYSNNELCPYDIDINKYNHCGICASNNCDYVYHGTEPKSQSYYDRCSGGWMIEYFRNKSNKYYI